MSNMELCDLPCPISTNLPPISTSLPPQIRITPNSIQDAHDWKILYHLRSTTKTLDPARIPPPPKLKIGRRRTFRVLTVIPARSTFASTTTNQVQEAAPHAVASQLYSHRHGTVISCHNGEICQTLSWKRKWRVCGGGVVVEVRGYRWQALQQEEEEDGGTVPPPSCVEEKEMFPRSPDYRENAEKKTINPGRWVPFWVKKKRGSEIWCWESREMASHRVDADGEETNEEVVALMEEGRLEFVDEGRAEEEKQRILLTAVAITEWERWRRRPGLADKVRQRVLKI